MADNNNTLADLLGLTRSTVEVGRVKFHVRPFQLKQFEPVKDIIAEVLAAAQVQKTYTAPDGNQVTFTDRDLMTGFMASRNLIPRFLALCVEIEVPDAAPAVTFDDLPLKAMTQVLKEVLAINEDFFREFWELALSTLERVEGATETIFSKVETLRDKAESRATTTQAGSPPSPIRPGLDLTQAAQPIGERSPQLFSVPEPSETLPLSPI